jgi:hypothetical protein
MLSAAQYQLQLHTTVTPLQLHVSCGMQTKAPRMHLTRCRAESTAPRLQPAPKASRFLRTSERATDVCVWVEQPRQILRASTLGSCCAAPSGTAAAAAPCLMARTMKETGNAAVCGAAACFTGDVQAHGGDAGVGHDAGQRRLCLRGNVRPWQGKPVLTPLIFAVFLLSAAFRNADGAAQFERTTTSTPGSTRTA